MPIEYLTGQQSMGTSEAFTSVGDDPIIFVSCAVYGDGNYGISTPSGWSRASYIQQDSGARGSYYRESVGAPAATDFALGAASYGSWTWVAVWNILAGGKTVGWNIAGSTDTSPGTEEAATLAASPALTVDDIQAVGSAHRSGSGSDLTPSGWTLRQSRGSWVNHARCFTLQSASSSVNPSALHTNESGPGAQYTAWARSALPLGGGWGIGSGGWS